MIGGATKHGRTARDAKYLAGHLLKEPDARVELINTAAPDLPEALADMQLARDGTRADSAFLHIHLSPSRSMTDNEIRKASEIVRRHLGAETHAAALVFHEKNRTGGDGNRHGHLVLGRVSPSGDVLPSGFEKVRLETAVRIAEFELGEAPTLGRHHGSAVRWLSRNGRQDVADWLAAAHGPNPDKPTSAASPDKRQALARQGIALADVRETVRSAWSRSDSATAFRAALAEAGFEVAPGNKVGVYVVQRDGQTVGSLDRLAKQKRAAVAARMTMEESDARTAEIESDASPSGNVRRSEGRQGSGREIGAVAELAGAQRGRGAGRVSRHAGGHLGSPAPDARSDADDGRKAGRRTRAAAAVAERQLFGLRLSGGARRNLASIREATQPSGHDKIRAHQLGRMDWSHALRQAHALGRDARALAESLQHPAVPVSPARANLAPTPLSEREALRAALRAEMSGRQHLDRQGSPSEGSKEIFRPAGHTRNQALTGIPRAAGWRASGGSKNPAAQRDELRAELRRAQASGRKRRRHEDEDDEEDFNGFSGPKM